MNYTNQLNKMMNELREEGKVVWGNSVGFYVDQFYVETSSITNIYQKESMELAKTFKTPKGALNFLLKN